jgi:hypothetical protein
LLKKSNNQIVKNQKRYICLQIQILKLKCKQSSGHWNFWLNFILEFGAESSVEYLIPCMFFMCVFSDSFCFCVFCWIPICFLYLRFSSFILLHLDFGYLKFSFFQNLFGKLKRKNFAQGAYYYWQIFQEKTVKNHTEQANSFSDFKNKI